MSSEVLEVSSWLKKNDSVDMQSTFNLRCASSELEVAVENVESRYVESLEEGEVLVVRLVTIENV